MAAIEGAMLPGIPTTTSITTTLQVFHNRRSTGAHTMTHLPILHMQGEVDGKTTFHLNSMCPCLKPSV